MFAAMTHSSKKIDNAGVACRPKHAWVIGTLVLLLGIADEAAASQESVIRTAAQTATEPKFVERMHNGKPAVAGLCIDIHRAIERIEPTIRFTGDQNWMPAIRIEAEVASGELDAACGLSRTRERTARLIFVGPPLFVVRYYLHARADDQLAIISGWDDVRRLGEEGVILTTHGFGAVTRLQDIGGLHIDSGATDAVRNLRKLVAKRGRFYFHREPGLKESIRNAGLEGQVRILPKVMDIQPFYLTVSKTLSTDTVARLDRAVAALAASGELAMLFEKWFAP